RRKHLDDFVACYSVPNRRERKETERFRRFGFDELIKRDGSNLEIFWLRDETLENADRLPAADVLAAEIVEDLQAALDLFTQVGAELQDRKRAANGEPWTA